MSPDQIIKQFQCKGRVREIKPFGTGHINDTFRVINVDPQLPDYLLQRINHSVFNEIGLMMNNIQKVTDHLRSKFLSVDDNAFSTLTVIPTIENQLFYSDSLGNYWRVFIFLKDHVAYDVVETEQQIQEGARAFGVFLSYLSDFDVSQIYPIIPDFHNVQSRLSLFRKAVNKDIKNRAVKARNLINFIFEKGDLMCRIEEAGKAGKIPIRVTHNDTKFNNVLLDKSGKARCVIDLDTVMPGYVHYDFGDGIRTSVSSAPEDEPNLNKIEVSLPRFKAFAQGYLEAAGSVLNEAEIRLLRLSGPTLAYIMGVRFLTDYLSGDIYYKIHSKDQNLKRSNAQLDLCNKMLELQDEMEEIILSVVSG